MSEVGTPATSQSRLHPASGGEADADSSVVRDADLGTDGAGSDGAGFVPMGVKQLISRMWDSLTWGRAGQTALILLAAGLAILLVAVGVVAGVAMTVYLIGPSFTVGAALTCGGGAAAYGLMRRRRAAPEPSDGRR